MVNIIDRRDSLVELLDLEADDWLVADTTGDEVTFDPSQDELNVVSCDNVTGELGVMLIDHRSGHVRAVSFYAVNVADVQNLSDYLSQIKDLDRYHVYLCGLGDMGDTDNGDGSVTFQDGPEEVREEVLRVFQSLGVDADRIQYFWNTKLYGFAEVMYVPPGFDPPSGQQVDPGVYVFTNYVCDPTED